MAPSRIAALIVASAALVFTPLLSADRVHAALQTSDAFSGTMTEQEVMGSEDNRRDEAEYQVASSELFMLRETRFG